ncbi:hypothetical protein ACWGNF_20750 [Streptomyces sp. NPDC055808]
MAHNVTAPPYRDTAASAGSVRTSEALRIYDRHGDALFSLALLLCRDVEWAVEAVVATVTQGCGTVSDSASDVQRQELAADLWHRYAAGSQARQGTSGSAYRPGDTDDSAWLGQQQALLGLVLFGCHTYEQAAALIGISAPTAALHLRTVLRRAAAEKYFVER